MHGIRLKPSSAEAMHVCHKHSPYGTRRCTVKQSRGRLLPSRKRKFLPVPGLPLLCTRAPLLFLPSGAAIEDASKRQKYQNTPNSYAEGMTKSLHIPGRLCEGIGKRDEGEAEVLRLIPEVRWRGGGWQNLKRRSSGRPACPTCSS